MSDVCLWECLCLCANVRMCMHVRVYALHCSCVYLSMYLCVCAYVCVRACGCGCVRLGVYNARTSMSEGVHVFLYTYTCVYANSVDCLNRQVPSAEEPYKTMLFLHTGPNHVGGRVSTPQREETRAFSHNYSKDLTEQS